MAVEVKTANSAGQVITPFEAVVDLTFEGSGALGVMFQEVPNPDNTTRPDIIVISLVPGGIASELNDLSPLGLSCAQLTASTLARDHIAR